tara:strand:- start:147 stop:680 length:534 start_codon:yes stop_codon:yes gene_type:complete
VNSQEIKLEKGNSLKKKNNVIDEEIIVFFQNEVVFGELETVKKLVSERPEFINAQDEYGVSALHNVMCEEQIETISFLIANGANMNIKNNQGISPLHLVCYKENAELLIEAGADINQLDNQGNSPLHIQASNGAGREEIIKYLIAKGADKLLENELGQTAFDIAKKRFESKILELLK